MNQPSYSDNDADDLQRGQITGLGSAKKKPKAHPHKLPYHHGPAPQATSARERLALALLAKQRHGK